MPKQCKQERKIDGRTAPAKRWRALIAAYEAQIGSSPSPATRSLIARAVSIEITLEGIEADQVAGKPYDAEKHARLAGSLARLLDRLGLTVRPGVPAAPDRTPLSVDTVIREPARRKREPRAKAGPTPSVIVMSRNWFTKTWLPPDVLEHRAAGRALGCLA
jgi:hypothetical protein